jgi:tRNA nucleotidyltransferase (CCA-adding enzyme)
LKGINAYGADLKANSVPGYVTELLILEYGNFEKTIKEIAEWEKGKTIDIEKHLRKEEALKRFHTAPLIVIDPTDATRNVAAALSINQFSRVIAAARAFNKKPSATFFFGKKEKPWQKNKIKKMFEKKEIIAIALSYPNDIPDIVWGQLKKLKTQAQRELEHNGFKVLSSSEWTDEKKQMAIVFELDSLELSKAMKRVGPNISDLENSAMFLEKHKKTIAGPRIEEGRWVIETEREFSHAKSLLENFLKRIKKQSKANIKQATKNSKVLTEKKLLGYYSKSKDFQLFFSRFLKGKEDFLSY